MLVGLYGFRDFSGVPGSWLPHLHQNRCVADTLIEVIAMDDELDDIDYLSFDLNDICYCGDDESSCGQDIFDTRRAVRYDPFSPE